MRYLAFLTAVALIGGPACAEDKVSPSRTMDELAACRAIGDATARLACFDRAAERVVAARTKGDLLVIDRARVVERKRARFGLAMTDGAVFGGGPEDDATEVKELDSTIREVRPASYGLWTMALANGSVWQTTESLMYAPKANEKIKLKTALLGAFKASIDGGRAVKVKRIR